MKKLVILFLFLLISDSFAEEKKECYTNVSMEMVIENKLHPLAAAFLTNEQSLSILKYISKPVIGAHSIDVYLGEPSDPVLMLIFDENGCFLMDKGELIIQYAAWNSFLWGNQSITVNNIR